VGSHGQQSADAGLNLNMPKEHFHVGLHEIDEFAGEQNSTVQFATLAEASPKARSAKPSR